MKKYIFIVEGKHDVSKLQEVLKNEIIVSINGSALDKSIDFLDKYQNDYRFVLCMDPDYQGELIRRKLENKYKNIMHIHFNKEISKNEKKTKIGLEHITTVKLQEIFENFLKTNNITEKSDINNYFLITHGIIGSKKSKELRELLSKKFNLGLVNGKTFLKRVNQLGINKKDIIEVLNETST